MSRVLIFFLDREFKLKTLNREIAGEISHSFEWDLQFILPLDDRLSLMANHNHWTRTRAASM